MGNPVEDNFVTRFILGCAVLFAMMAGGAMSAGVFTAIGIPLGDWLGVGFGAIVVFAAFSVLYRRYDAAFDAG